MHTGCIPYSWMWSGEYLYKSTVTDVCSTPANVKIMFDRKVLTTLRRVMSTPEDGSCWPGSPATRTILLECRHACWLDWPTIRARLFYCIASLLYQWHILAVFIRARLFYVQDCFTAIARYVQDTCRTVFTYFLGVLMWRKKAQKAHGILLAVFILVRLV